MVTNAGTRRSDAREHVRYAMVAQPETRAKNAVSSCQHFNCKIVSVKLLTLTLTLALTLTLTLTQTLITVPGGTLEALDRKLALVVVRGHAPQPDEGQRNQGVATDVAGGRVRWAIRFHFDVL